MPRKKKEPVAKTPRKKSTRAKKPIDGQAESPETIAPPRSWLRWIAFSFAMLVLLAVAIVFGFRTAVMNWSKRPYGKSEAITIKLSKGSSLRATSQTLQQSGAINDANYFTAYALLSGNRAKLQAGNYRIKLPITPQKLIARLQSGSFQRKLTIPEGWTASQIEAILLKEGWTAKSGDWTSVVAAPIPATLFGEEVPAGAEGFCFPDTYLFEDGTDVAKIRDQMLKKFAETWNALDPTKRDPRTEKLSVFEIIALASIIERETRIPAELPLIGSVFVNRLKKGMKLQSCATVHYALGEVWDRALTYDDLKIASPYNTYQRVGLPAGPIRNPGKGAIEAALRPAANDDLYFVHRGDGTHEFTKTFKQHQAAIKKFRDTDLQARLNEPES